MTAEAETATFVRSICAAPDDDAPRLVYADWLDEHGGEAPCGHCEGKGYWHPNPIHSRGCPVCRGTGRRGDGRAERAEFIRVQCELARGCPTERRVDALRRRERELLEGYWKDWHAPAGVGVVVCENLNRGRSPGHFTLAFRRGFVEAIHCPSADFERHAEGVFRCQPIAEVRLSDKHPQEVWDGCHMWDERFGREGDPDYIPGWLQPYMDDVTRHPTLAAALAEMSEACVAYGRDKAGLPPLAPRPAGA